VVTSRELLAAEPDKIVSHLVARAPITIGPNETARAAAVLMAREGVGRLVVVHDDEPEQPIGVLSRSDLVDAFIHAARANAHAPEGLA
jgi:CBS domain-containing protein